MPAGQLAGFGEEVIGFAGDAFGGNRTIDDRGDFLDALAVADATLFGEQAWVRSYAADDAEPGGGADLVYRSCIQEELHMKVPASAQVMVEEVRDTGLRMPAAPPSRWAGFVPPPCCCREGKRKVERAT